MVSLYFKGGMTLKSPADAKRPLDDGFPESVTSLLQLKKLKLRANATSASSPTRDS